MKSQTASQGRGLLKNNAQIVTAGGRSKIPDRSDCRDPGPYIVREASELNRPARDADGLIGELLAGRCSAYVAFESRDDGPSRSVRVAPAMTLLAGSTDNP